MGAEQTIDSHGETPFWSEARLGRMSLAAAALLLVLFRLHAFPLPLETDECNYAYIGHRLLEGDRLYVDVWDHQPFGVFVLFAGAIATFGNEPVVFRWLATAFSLASLLLIFAIARRTAGTFAAVAAAFFFAVVSSDPGTAGEGANREIHMNAFVLLGWYLALLRRDAPRWAVLGSGLALGLGSTLKTILALHWLALAAWLVFTAWSKPHHQSRPRSAVETLLLFGAGPAAVWAASFAWFGLTGRMTEFLDAVFLFNLSYAEAEAGWPLRFARFFAPPRFPFVFHSAIPVWVAGALGTLLLAIEGIRRRGDAALLVPLMAAAGFVAVILPAHYWPHYYYLLVPVMVLAATAGLSLAVDTVAGTLHQARSGRKPWLQTKAAVLGMLLLSALVLQWHHYLRQTPLGITIRRYNTRDFWGRAMGLKVGAVTEPGDTVFVYSNEAEIYYYSGRRCASRYTMITGLLREHAGAERRRRVLMDELRDRMPRVILVLFDEEPFPEWKAFLERHYVYAGVDTRDGTNEPIMFAFTLAKDPVPAIDWSWDARKLKGRK